MAPPAKEYNWLYNVNQQCFISASDDELAARNLILIMKHIWCDIRIAAWTGSFSKTGNTIRYTPSERGYGPTSSLFNEFSPTLFIATDVGRTVRVAGATTAANNGYFTITAVDPSGLWIEWTNASGATESHVGSASVLKGSFPGAPNGRTPWRVYGSCDDGGKGFSIGNGVDRWVTEADLRSTTTGNQSWVVLENEITGAQILFHRLVNSTSQEYINIHISVSAERGYTGGNATTRPTAPDEVIWNNGNFQWMGLSNGQVITGQWWLHFLITDDGKHTHFWGAIRGFEFWHFYCGQPEDVVDDTDGIPWTGQRNMLGWRRYDGTNLPFHPSLFNDNTGPAAATIDHLGVHPVSPGPHTGAFYWAAESLADAMVTERDYFGPNAVNDEWIMLPIGLVFNTALVQGRHGRLADIYVAPSNDRMPIVSGWTAPGDGSRQWLKLRQLWIPWNGTRYKNREGD